MKFLLWKKKLKRAPKIIQISWLIKKLASFRNKMIKQLSKENNRLILLRPSLNIILIPEKSGKKFIV
jgi:hypothetical protein